MRATGDAGDGDGDAGDGDGDAGDGDGDAGDGDGDAMGGMSGDGDDPEYPDTMFTYDPSLDAQPETCAATQIEAEEIFLDMFVILDRSGSMTQPFGNNNSNGYCEIGEANVGSRWCNAINALYGFFSDPSTVGTGFSYAEFSDFEDDECGAFPMDVGFGILEEGDGNGQLDALEAALNDDNPGGFTHTEAAIHTLIAETNAHVPTGTRRTISVLITDGDPFGCEDDRDELNEMLVEHYTSTGIPTFIIGMEGVSANNLEELAVNAGAAPHTNYCIDGDGECSYYSVGDGNPAAFMDALANIRSAVLGCEYAVPQADVGLSNLDTLLVQFTPSEGAAEITLEQMADEGACSSDDQYWGDFSGGADPIIKLCPATCATRADGASIDISLECEGS